MATVAEAEEPLSVGSALHVLDTEPELDEQDAELVQRVAGHLGLFADLTHADAALFVR